MYSDSQGYIPRTEEEIRESIRVRANSVLGTDYSSSEFIGTNIHKIIYPVVQEMMEIENNLSQCFSKLTDYIDKSNEKINEPAITKNMVLKKIKNLGVDASSKPISTAEAGNIFLCVDLDGTEDNYSYLTQEIAKILRDNTAAGTVFNGSQEVSLPLDNGQMESFKFYLSNKINIKLKLTLKISRNNQNLIPSDDEAKTILLNNLKNLYHIGNDFEPEKYAEINRDFPCCSEVMLEYSLNDGETWISTVANLNFDTKYTVNAEDITIVRT